MKLLRNKERRKKGLDGEKVATAEFSRTTVFSRAFRRCLKTAILPFIADADRTDFIEQFDLSSRNVEMAIEGLGKLLTLHPVKSWHVLHAVASWIYAYFSAQQDMRGEECFWVYQKKDQQIPFKPEEDIMYAYMIAQIAYIGNILAKHVATQQLANITRGFVDLSRLAIEVYDQYPTLMPRYLNHRRISLRVIQKLDQPLNCCPSLHIAFSIFLDNVGEHFIATLPNQEEVFQSIRYSTIRMFNSVLYTKQHALVDVAFGMLCAKIVFEDRFDYHFNDFVSVFDDLKLQHPEIDYDEIAHIYQVAVRMYDEGVSFTRCVGHYLESNHFTKRVFVPN